MRNLKFLPAIIGAILVIAIILFVTFHFIFLDLFVDLWWYQSLKLESYFWLRLLYRFFLSGGVTLAFFSIFFFHFWIKRFRFHQPSATQAANTNCASSSPPFKEFKLACVSTQIWGMLQNSFKSFLVDMRNSKTI